MKNKAVSSKKKRERQKISDMVKLGKSKRIQVMLEPNELSRLSEYMTSTLMRKESDAMRILFLSGYADWKRGLESGKKKTLQEKLIL